MYKKLVFWGFISPCLVAFLLVVVIPFFFGFYYSFTDWNGINSIVSFVGIDNYMKAFKDPQFYSSFFFTIKVTILSIFIINIVGFFLAILVTRNLKISNGLRTIFFMPNLIGGLILGFIWQFIFIKVFGTIGQAIGATWMIGWLSDATTGYIGLVILMTWQMAGYLMVIYIAGIQNIPTELIEASEIDGANFYQRLKAIIFPLIRPSFTICLFLTLSNTFKLFDQNLSLTGGGPANSTQMLAMNIYNTAFKANDMGVAQAKAVIFFIVIGVITISQVYISKKGEVEM